MTLSPRFDPSDPAVVEDPYPLYSALRSAGRTARGAAGQVVVLRHSDVSALLRSSKLSNQFPEEYRHFSIGTGPASEFLARLLLHRDPPAHRAIREMLGGALHARLPHLAGCAEALAVGLVEQARSKGNFDAVEDLAIPLPFAIICELLGVPRDDCGALRPHAVALSRAFTLRAGSDDRHAADAGVAFLRSYLTAMLLHRGSERGSSEVLTAAREFHQRGAPFADVVDNLVFLLFAGFETTTNLIATGSALLTRYPSALGLLRSAPALVTQFIEEVLRFDAPIQSRVRVVAEAISIDSRTLRPGRLVLLLIGSANRDPAVFSRPDEFDIARSPNPHLSFGIGAHYCLGAQLARIEAAALFGALLRGCPNLSGDGMPVRDPTSVFRSYQAVPLRCAGI